MRTIAMLGAAALAAMSVAADAAPTISFAGGTGTAAPGTTVFQDFEGYASGSWADTNTQFVNPTGTNNARPAFGSTGNFAAIRANGSYTVNFGPTNLFSFVLGSLDSYNSLNLLLADGSSVSYAGGEIIGGLSYASGNRTSATSNGVVTYNANGGPQIVGATFMSGKSSFEIDNLAAAVPEPSTWAMMIFGFGAIGGAMRHRRRGARVFA
ncbi:PEPxxWA-CTERM sorting domain-containing protein [Sphingomonas sp. MMSM20]|uniref:PEPxxWA-CTERM sorting domain-containing protein n=1 Tax=Sphingomonas lycopersici TaxID=2951807 RepID=UPI002237532A|nr:PEPxxWA-CTERM sorting domain-containing protein [Sphingomonas lycopersici]MCW6532357.1 PEPxxWA-CTERM sorting domain-containing protein [Sphingomonas lycopersici]